MLFQKTRIKERFLLFSPWFGSFRQHFQFNLVLLNNDSAKNTLSNEYDRTTYESLATVNFHLLLCQWVLWHCACRMPNHTNFQWPCCECKCFYEREGEMKTLELLLFWFYCYLLLFILSYSVRMSEKMLFQYILFFIYNFNL